MKIAYLITTLSYGGAERQLLSLCRNLQAKGHEVSVGYLKPCRELFQAFQVENIQVRGFDMQNIFDFRVWFRVRAWLKEYTPDLLHTHLFKADLYGGLAALSLGIPLISTKHNVEQYLKLPWIAWIARKIAKRSLRIIAVSQAVRDHLIEVAGFHPDWIEVILVGIDELTIVQKPIPSSNIRFGVVARLAKQKGHQMLLRAFRKASQQYPQMELLLFGDGPLRESLMQQIRQQQLENSVRFFGALFETDEIYQQFDVCVLPSLWEGAPVVLLEAMIRGIPIIATAVGGVPELLSSECGVLIPSSDEQALTQALIKISVDGDFRSRLSKCGPVHVKSFSFEKTTESHLSLYKKVLDSSSAR